MTHNPTHPAGGAGAVKLTGIAERALRLAIEDRQASDTVEMNVGDLSVILGLILALSPTPAPEPTAADMRAFGASEVAAYEWPNDTPEHRAARAAYCDGAACAIPPVPEPVAEPVVVDAQLEAMASVFRHWAEYNVAQRAREGLSTEPDTHVITVPPEWPRHGTLRNWCAALGDARAVIAALSAPASKDGPDALRPD